MAAATPAEPNEPRISQAELLRDRVRDDRVALRAANRHREAVDTPEPGEGMPRVAVDLLTSERGLRAIVRGEILVHSEDVARAAEILTPRGFAQRERRHTCDLPIERFVGAGSPREVQHAVTALVGAGIRANANQIVAFSIRGKSDVAPRGGALATASKGAPPTRCAHVVVIDTGIADPGAGRDDGWLDGIAVTAENTDPLTAINRRQGDVDPNTTLPYLDDAAGHGTFVAGIVRQMAPHTTVTVMRALDSDGVGSEDVVACAIHRAGRLEPRPDVINVSLGQESPDGRPPLALSLALEGLDPEIIVVAAAGNSPDETPVWPAAFRRVVAVAGLDADGAPAIDWSKRGAWVDVSASAEAVVSTYVEGRENPDPTRNTDGVWDDWTAPSPAATWLGTSFAAPRIAGLIARRVESGMTAREGLADLVRTAPYAPGFGRLITE